MATELLFRPLDRPLPEPAGGHRRAQFRSGYDDTLRLLRDEASRLGASRVVIQVDVSEPGVVVNLDSEHGPLRYATAAFAHWQDNLRGIALGLEALRAVARYGIGESGEQYRGWAALPVGGGTGMSDEDAAHWLATKSAHPRYEGDAWRRLLDEPGTLDHARTEAVKRLHPDRGGDHEEFTLLGKVVEQLRTRHGRS